MTTMASTKPEIGFCGLGLMGFGMATHLLKQGYQVKGFDVFAKTMERWKEAGGIVSETLEDSARDVEYYVVMVASMPQAQIALFGEGKGGGASGGIVGALPKGATIVLMSTVPATYVQSVQSQLQDIGRLDIHLIDAPVSGGAGRASLGTLSIMASASSPAALDKGRWLVEELSEKLYIVPPNGDHPGVGIGGGSNLKMAHQVLAGIHILATSEALGLAARLGLRAEEVVQKVIKAKGDAWSWMFENRSPRTLKEDYYPGASALTIILKDVGIITTTSRELSFPLPLSTVAEQIYVAGLSQGYGPHDDAGVVRLYYDHSIAQVRQRHKPTSPQTVTDLALYTSSPGSLIESESVDGIGIIIRYLRAVHIVAAAEAIAFAYHLGLDLAQFRDLVNDAAGASTMFRKLFDGMSARLTAGADSVFSGVEGESTLAELQQELNMVLKEARKVECSLWLGIAASNVVGAVTLKKKVKGGVASDIIDLWN